MMEKIRFSETFIIGATLRHIPEHCILHSHRRVNFKSYISIDRLGSIGDLMCGFIYCVPEDSIHHSHPREKLKSYIALTDCGL
jgi:hypothetical protein